MGTPARDASRTDAPDRIVAASTADPSMRSAEARAPTRDKAIIKRLNQEQLAHVQGPDVRYAKG